MSKASFPRRFFSGLWRVITSVRLALSNLLFIAMLALIYFVYIGGGPEPLPAKAALLLNISGTVVDQRTLVDPLQAILREPSAANHEVLLRDVIEAIDFATRDEAINSIVMDLDSLMYLGISKTQEIIPALERFRATGKPVVAVGDYYTQDQYLLASHADEIILHPLGGVALEGYGSYRNYFREALEKISVNMHVFRAGENKGAVEPYLRDDMSDVERTVTRRWLVDLWHQYTRTVEAQRGIDAGAVDGYINQFAEQLAAQGGDTAQAAVEAGLVDSLMGRREANDYLADLVGAKETEYGIELSISTLAFQHGLQPLLSPGYPDGPEKNSCIQVTAAFLEWAHHGGSMQILPDPSSRTISLRLSLASPGPIHDPWETLAADLVTNDLFWQRHLE